MGTVGGIGEVASEFVDGEGGETSTDDDDCSGDKDSGGDEQISQCLSKGGGATVVVGAVDGESILNEASCGMSSQ